MKIIDLDSDRFSDFYSMQDLVSVWSGSMIVWSWGAHEFTKVNSSFLSFKVMGRKFKGTVYLAVNGLDLFEIYFCNSDNMIIDERLDVFIDDLIPVIDSRVEAIEKPTK